MSRKEVKLSDGSKVLVRLAAGKKLSEDDRRELEEFRKDLEERARKGKG